MIPEEELQSMLQSKISTDLIPGIPISQYTLYLIVSVIVCAILVIAVAKKTELHPKRTFWMGGMEHLMDWAHRDIGVSQLGPTTEKHMPFLMTLLFFILTANVIGLIPGVFVATGATGATFALACFSFIYFIVYGVKTNGALKYLGSFAPKGVIFPMRVVLWVIELFSTCLRLITLAIRLFANMYAGHLVLGVFSLLTSTAIATAISTGAFMTAVPSVLWMAFLVVMYVIEFMMACIQAYVFTLLSSVYIQLAEQGE